MEKLISGDMEKINFKGKIHRNAQRQKREQKQIQNKYFQQLYNQTKYYKLPKPMINTQRYFSFPKGTFQFNWPKQSLAVYPVLCSRADLYKNESFQLSEQNISLLTGMNEDDVRYGINFIIDGDYGFLYGETGKRIPYLQKDLKQDGQRRYYVYQIGFVRGDMMQGWEYYPFYHSIIELGIWARLKSRAKLLYLALRNHSEFRKELYEKIEGTTEYKSHRWEVCICSWAELCRDVNISNRNLTPVIMQLERFRLIEVFDQWVKVWLVPLPDSPYKEVPEQLSNMDEVMKYYKKLIDRLRLGQYKKYNIPENP